MPKALVESNAKDHGKLAAENRLLREALESMMRDTGLVSLMRPDQVRRNHDALAATQEQPE